MPFWIKFQRKLEQLMHEFELINKYISKLAIRSKSSLKLNDQKMANTWDGDFPNGEYDGFKDWGTVDIFSYQPNKFGLYNMIGNVWELVADRFEKTHSPRDQRNPKGPLNGEFIVARGGSYLCHDSYCARYRNSSRQAVKFNTTTGNIGFRIAFD